MNEENQIGTLAEMTKESFLNRPEQAVEATEEYLLNLAEDSIDKATKLKDKLNVDVYAKQFHEAITHTSLMVFLMSIIATSANNSDLNVDFNSYAKEFIESSGKDDLDIYNMRLFYLNGLTGRELGFGQINQSDFNTKDELEVAQKIAQKQLHKYDELLSSLKKLYLDTKIEK